MENEMLKNEFELFYGVHYKYMQQVEQKTVDMLEAASRMKKVKSRVVSRIKNPESMRKKLAGDGLPETAQNAILRESDAIGVRIIVDALDDVYKMGEYIKSMTGRLWRIVEVKDYIQEPKTSGYRSLHIIVSMYADDALYPEMFVEIQLRTAVMDCWASLEHIAMYKNAIAVTPEIEDLLETYRAEVAKETEKLNSKKGQKNRPWNIFQGLFLSKEGIPHY